MKTKQIIIVIAILSLGVLIGKFMFSSSSDVDEEHQHQTKEEHWTCSMHPQIDLSEFGACPICGMDLILKENGDEALAHDAFELSQNAMALANIETLIVGNIGEGASHNDSTINLSGKIAVNENESAIQTAHFGGRIEKLYFKSEGEYVNKGALLATIYSPELVTAQNELIEAMSIKELQPELYKAVRNKLKNWKITESQILSIEQNKKVITNFNMYTNVSGYIDAVLAKEGNHVNEGTPLFNVSNLESVWAVFDVYEKDIANLKIGQSINIKLNAYPEKDLNATINFIDPILDINRRTISVRATLSNKQNKLKPGMFISSEIALNLANDLNTFVVIPKTAVLWTGKRSIVYVKVDKNKPVFELREVQLGNDLGENYKINSGIENGEEIVINGAFTVDAAAQLQGKKSMMNKDGGKTSTGHEDHLGVDNTTSDNNDVPTTMNERIKVASEFQNQLKVVFHAYITLKNALVNDDAESTRSNANLILDNLGKVNMKLLTDNNAHSHWMTVEKEIKSSASLISKTNGIKEQRNHFKNLSEHLISAIQIFGINQTVYSQFCPMADNNNGADWLSLEKQISNPYFGDKMLRCGRTKQTIN